MKDTNETTKNETAKPSSAANVIWIKQQQTVNSNWFDLAEYDNEDAVIQQLKNIREMFPDRIKFRAIKRTIIEEVLSI